MQPGSNNIIVDTSCIILLHKIGELDFLKKIFQKIFITPEIADEFGNHLPDWFKVETIIDKHYQQILETELDSGEASAIALYFQIENAFIILDDLKARQFAEKLRLRFSGTLGLLLYAKQNNIIPSLKNIIEKIQQTNFRFSQILLEGILKEAGE